MDHCGRFLLTISRTIRNVESRIVFFFLSFSLENAKHIFDVAWILRALEKATFSPGQDIYKKNVVRFYFILSWR